MIRDGDTSQLGTFIMQQKNLVAQDKEPVKLAPL